MTTFYERILTIFFLFSSEFIVLVHVNFIFENMSYHSAISLSLSVLFMLILIPFFYMTCNYIIQEYEYESKINLSNSKQFKTIYDSLQEGIMMIS